MKNNSFYVITVTENGKFFSYAERISNCNNLVNFFPTNAKTINACDTWKEAKEVADYWNKGWKNKGILSYEIKRHYRIRLTY